MSATVLGSWSGWRAQSRDLEKQSMLRVGAVTEARRDMKDVERSCITVKKRRACPEGTPLRSCGRCSSPKEFVARGPRGRIPDEEGRAYGRLGPCGTAPVSCAIIRTAPLAWHHSSGPLWPPLSQVRFFLCGDSFPWGWMLAWQGVSDGANRSFAVGSLVRGPWRGPFVFSTSMCSLW